MIGQPFPRHNVPAITKGKSCTLIQLLNSINSTQNKAARNTNTNNCSLTRWQHSHVNTRWAMDDGRLYFPLHFHVIRAAPLNFKYTFDARDTKVYFGPGSEPWMAWMLPITADDKKCQYKPSVLPPGCVVYNSLQAVHLSKAALLPP